MDLWMNIILLNQVIFYQKFRAPFEIGVNNILISMKEEDQDQNMDILSQSEGMNEDQQALFLNIQRSKSNDSVFGKLFLQAGDAPDRSLVWDSMPHFTNNIVVPQTRSNLIREKEPPEPPKTQSIKIFKHVKKEKVHSRCDYDKNICGYITKKVIREFVSKNYEEEVNQLIKKYGKCTYNECKAYYLRKVEMVTGPSHMPDLFQPSSKEPESIANCKRVFKKFYRWFLKERYLRYLLIEGKMKEKQAYIQYKNRNLFRYAREDEEEELVPQVRTRSRSNMKLQQN